MDEKEYRSAYDDINPLRCVFEKAINSRSCNCSRAVRFNLADREGVSCQDENAQKNCVNLLGLLRDNGRFLLQQTSIDGQLPHNAEIKIQNGGVRGLLSVVSKSANTATMSSQHAAQNTSSSAPLNEDDIAGLVTAAVQQYQSLEQLPYSEIMQVVSAFRTRPKRRKKT